MKYLIALILLSGCGRTVTNSLDSSIKDLQVLQLTMTMKNSCFAGVKETRRLILENYKQDIPDEIRKSLAIFCLSQEAKVVK